MRKLLALALLTGLLIIGWASFNPASSTSSDMAANMASDAQRQSQYMADLHRGDVPIPTPATVAVSPDAVETRPVAYGAASGDEPFTGYLAQPADATESLPGLIVIQEWWGLNDNIRAMTRRLAAEGYTALAVDLYDGQVAETPEEARSLVQAALENPDLLTQNLVSAYEYLSGVMNAPTVGTIGWCFGGTWSLNTALALPDQLDAAVIYYGGGITTDAEQLETLQMPIQGHFGSLDTRPSPETVEEFKSTLDALGKNAEIYMYEGADHAFANPSGTRYNEEAAELAWERTIEFLDQHLK